MPGCRSLSVLSLWVTCSTQINVDSIQENVYHVSQGRQAGDRHLARAHRGQVVQMSGRGCGGHIQVAKLDVQARPIRRRARSGPERPLLSAKPAGNFAPDAELAVEVIEAADAAGSLWLMGAQYGQRAGQ